MKEDYYLSIPELYPKPVEPSEAERAKAEAERSRMRREKEAQERARWAESVGRRYRHLHEVRAAAGRKGAARRWAQHTPKRRKPTSAETDDSFATIKLAGALFYFGWRILSRLRSCKTT